ncbi:MAG: 1,4-dihydroxy-2-naphthoate octaprenyltransferase [Bacteroidota bacterium]|nr:1,4-dihydroxy-2-naphthoate octaprenyltransferase [Bacteroidota bacterium]
MKEWIRAARLRTLPLSVSGIIVGSFYALSKGYFNGLIFTLALLTTIGFQVVSNFANDYGDGVKGTDSKHRIGPQRAIQSGKISPTQMKRGILISCVISLLLTLWLILESFGKDHFFYPLLFLVLGITSIVAALKYTIGNSAYGYKGLGDIFVFLFFGLLSVLGCYFLYTQQFSWHLLLPASAIGLLSCGVLNLNNLRDEDSDRISNKNTLIVKMGGKNGRKYHYILIISSLICLILFGIFEQFKPLQYLFLLGYLPVLLHLKRINGYTQPKQYDPELKALALSTFLISILLSVFLNI